MRSIGCIVGFLLLSIQPLWAESHYRHKSEAELARLTPEQRVDEFCNEYIHHRFFHDEYESLLRKYLQQDRGKSLLRIAQVITEYNPKDTSTKGEENALRYDAVVARMITLLDSNVFRLRAYEEGRTVIQAMKIKAEQLREYVLDRRGLKISQGVVGLELTLLYIQQLEGIGESDKAIRNSLILNHKINLTSEELQAFTDYLCRTVPAYPSQCPRKMVTKKENMEELKRAKVGGYSLICTSSDFFYQAYLNYKASK